MRLPLTLLFALLCSLTANAQSTQRGVVMEYRSEKLKAPLAGVAIAAANAGSTMSDTQGRFTLNFRTLKAGDAIVFKRIEKNGYEIMNKEAVEAARVSRKSEASELRGFDVSIILCKASLLNEIRDGYRSVTVKRYEKQLKEQEAEIERLKKEGKLKEEEYNERIDALEAEFEEKLADINVYIDRFARIDMTALSEAESRTIKLVQEGRFEEAIANYESQDLVGLLNKARKERRELIENIERIEKTIMSKEEENTRLRESISRQIDLLHLAGGAENMEKIHHILREVFEADTTDITARREYALSLYGRGENEQACATLAGGLDNCGDNADRAMMAIDLALYNMAIDEEMMKYIGVADSLTHHISETDGRLYSRIVPSVAYVQLLHHFNKQDLPSCRRVAERAEKNWAPDSLSISSLLDYATLIEVLAGFYSQVSDHERSVWAAKEGVRLCETSYRTAPWRSNLFAACATACDVMAMEGRWGEAEDYARRSLAVAGEVMKAKPTQSLMKDVCENAFKMYWALVDIKATQLADSIPQFVEPIYARLHDNQRELLTGQYGLFLLAKGDIAEATPLLNEDMGEEAAEITIAPFRAKKALTEGKKEEAVRIMLKAIDAAKQQYREEPDAWNKDTYCCHCITLAEIYAKTGDRKNSKKWLRQAKKLVAFESNRIKINICSNE